MIRIVYDGPSSGLGHKVRADYLASKYISFGIQVFLQSLDDPPAALSLGLQPDHDVPTIVDSYRPQSFLSKVWLGNPQSTLQIVDFDEQQAWGSWILDPFRATPPSRRNSFRGLNYAIVPELQGVSRTSPQFDGVIVSLGSSSLEALDRSVMLRLSNLWEKVTIISNRPHAFELPKNCKVVKPKSRTAFWNLANQHRFMICNSGVTCLERIKFGMPGLCIPTEPNQKYAAMELLNSGANIFGPSYGTWPQLSSLTNKEHFTELKPEQVSLGEGLDEVLKWFANDQLSQ